MRLITKFDWLVIISKALKGRIYFLPVLIALVFLIGCSNEQTSRPNILLLVADDLAYSDLSFLGSKIQTPNLDELASEGIFFGRFHTGPVCTPSYAMLLTGNDNHAAGWGAMWDYDGSWGYEGELSERVVTFPELLQSNGYFTCFAGKWDQGRKRNDPVNRGFDKSFVNFSGEHYALDSSNLSENGNTANWPKDGYGTTLYVNKLIEYLSVNESDKPFFAMAAFTSPHWPLQVDEKYWKKYEDTFNDGYLSLREKNLENLILKRLVDQETELPEIHPLVVPWDSLDEETKRIESRKMALYAGMVNHLDQEIGRLIEHLKHTGKYENTVIIFLSDNGAAAEDFYNQPWATRLREKYNNEFNNMGSASSYVAYGPPWAEAGSAPFRYFKGYVAEGGILAPMIIKAPNLKRTENISLQTNSIQDIAPTILELAGIKTSSAENEILGESMASYLRNELRYIHDDEFVFAQEHLGHAMVLKGDWKIVTEGYPLVAEKFRLYNLKNDISEQFDLSEKYPTKKRELMVHWKTYETKYKIKTR